MPEHPPHQARDHIRIRITTEGGSGNPTVTWSGVEEVSDSWFGSWEDFASYVTPGTAAFTTPSSSAGGPGSGGKTRVKYELGGAPLSCVLEWDYEDDNGAYIGSDAVSLAPGVPSGFLTAPFGSAFRTVGGTNLVMKVGPYT